MKTIICGLLLLLNTGLGAQRQMETLRRGLIAQRKGDGTVFLSWRLLATDSDETSFTIYRSKDGQPFQKIVHDPVTTATSFTDSSADLKSAYRYAVIPAGDKLPAPEKEIAEVKPGAFNAWHLSIPLNIPPPGEVYGSKYEYSANDVAVGDLDGDGEWEIILKWEPSNARNPPQTGFTGNQIIDAYTLAGKQLWRIDLGVNIRAGAAYTQMLVYDFDGDGKAELVCKTADGTRDGKGKVIGDSGKDWRNKDEKDGKWGKIAEGPEYITVFDGQTGAALASTAYIPTRYPIDGWGGIGGNGGNDNTVGRSDRFTACVAYLDGKRPSFVMVRGWYGRTVLSAFDWRGGKITNRWVFDSSVPGLSGYSGMANHNLSVGDVDGDGKDEICVGAMTVDDNGKGLYTTGLRHGDALHLTDLDPSRPGLEVFGIHESEGKTLELKTPGIASYDAATGEILFSMAPGVDVGRGVAADIDPEHPGFENWGGPGGLRDVKGRTISERAPRSTNFLVWWDGDLTRELLDKNYIAKWNWKEMRDSIIFTAEGCVSNNGTKATPALSVDLFGDWREEVIWRSVDNRELRIYSTTVPTPYRFVTLMQDPHYRLSVAWQNVSYNQPPHTGFYLGAGMGKPSKPAIILTPIKNR